MYKYLVCFCVSIETPDGFKPFQMFDEYIQVEDKLDTESKIEDLRYSLLKTANSKVVPCSTTGKITITGMIEVKF